MKNLSQLQDAVNRGGSSIENLGGTAPSGSRTSKIYSAGEYTQPTTVLQSEPIINTYQSGIPETQTVTVESLPSGLRSSRPNIAGGFMEDATNVLDGLKGVVDSATTVETKPEKSMWYLIFGAIAFTWLLFKKK